MRVRRSSFIQSLHLEHPEVIYLQDLYRLYPFTIRNISDEPLRFHLALSNPDNYQLTGPTIGFLEPDA